MKIISKDDRIKHRDSDGSCARIELGGALDNQKPIVRQHETNRIQKGERGIVPE